MAQQSNSCARISRSNNNIPHWDAPNRSTNTVWKTEPKIFFLRIMITIMLKVIYSCISLWPKGALYEMAFQVLSKSFSILFWWLYVCCSANPLPSLIIRGPKSYSGTNMAGGNYAKALLPAMGKKKAGAQLLTGTGVLCTRAIKDGSS